MGRLEKHQFDQLEGLLSAAFRSKHAFVVNKVAETWNALAKDDEELECSDDLKSVVSSLRSAVDVVPGTETSDGDFGAQTALFIESQEVVVLSTGSSHDAEQQVTTTTRSSRLNQSKKRHLESTPEQPLEIPPKKRSAKSSKARTPPLRHDNSQIQFEAIPDSSPRVEESQHFTDRQKEVRERQKENAMAYSDIRSTSPSQAVGTSSNHKEEVQPPKEIALPVQNTPEKASTYQELISSTPTPRRGQFIPLEGDNDPPSSPPEPRPYPLLSEIRSRSRASSSMENWEFSSPPSSPVTSRQQVAHDADLPYITMTDESVQASAATPTKSRKARGPQTPTKVTNSHPRETRSQGAIEHDSISGPGVPKTTQRSALGERAMESPKSGDDEFVDARTEIERSSPVPESGQPEKDTSFALSEGDESRMMKFIVELESRQCESPLHGYEPSSVPKAAHECITVRGESESEDEAGENGALESMHAIIPSTPVEESAGGPGSDTKKRKREVKSLAGRRQKRKSTGKAELPSLDEDKSRVGQKAATSTPRRAPASETSTGVRTRQSVRKEQERRRMSQKQALPDERDTDDELMSQIIGESYAASQSQPESTQESVSSSFVEESMNMDSVLEEAVKTKTEPELETPKTHPNNGNKADYILGFLKGGVETLQDTSLSRAEVNKIEDVLMDLKRALYAAEERGRN